MLEIKVKKSKFSNHFFSLSKNFYPYINFVLKTLESEPGIQFLENEEKFLFNTLRCCLTSRRMCIRIPIHNSKCVYEAERNQQLVLDMGAIKI